MSLGEELRRERAKLTHSKFAETNRRVNHIHHAKLVLPTWADEYRRDLDAYAGSWYYPNLRDATDYERVAFNAYTPNSLDPRPEINHRGMPHRLDLLFRMAWKEAFDACGISVDYEYADAAPRFHVMNDGKLGFFLLLRDPPNPFPDLQRFSELCGDAITLLRCKGRVVLPTNLGRSVPDECWINELYARFGRGPKEIEGGASIEWLPVEATLASAMAIEQIIDDPECKAGQQSADAANEENSRPAYARDHLWLQWSDGGLTPAEIRDRWNAMRDEERKALVKKLWSKIKVKEQGREVVEKALDRARKERVAKG